MKYHLTIVTTSLLLAGCISDGSETAERRPGEPRFIGVCEIDDPRPGVALSRQAFSAPSESIAEARVDELDCSRTWVEPYSAERLEELSDPATPPASYQP